MKEVHCLGCGETYLVTENILTEIRNEKLSSEGYCGIVREKVGFMVFEDYDQWYINGLSE